MKLTALLLSLLFAGSVSAGPITFNYLNGGQQMSDTFDLTDPDTRAGFTQKFGHIPAIGNCIEKANMATDFMEERDTGVTEDEHLAEIRRGYEEAKPSRHIYVDFQRLVRDVHRVNSPRSGGGFVHTNPDALWDSEFRGCFAPVPGTRW